ncbi:sulfite exporter TauE/SafE family protein [Zestomonas carbonaria]|uniref:Probable membrane transporter protein n=1 Tax=Zestomonas carbonaria TaxID=2762745 RepID=A0A7U7ERU2_9GAMM|nr:sulfite exporter TauE/SafE family protein [Pseudomonas carbonaria]CAD5110012.1 hypothetical protein PSEWESI4_04328 [Pseudomonas carbonaria]
MEHVPLPLACAAFLLVALLYASVGQAGASGYIAVMALLGFAPAQIKPLALALNSLVSLLVVWRFGRAGHFRWELFRPLALGAAPMALLGGYWTLPGPWFERLLGLLLLIAAIPTLLRPPSDRPAVPPPCMALVLAGATIGLLSGLTGMGGGVLLAPLLLHCRWAEIRSAAALSSAFILVNSVAALAGHWSAMQRLPAETGLLAASVAVGGLLGAHLGSRRLSTLTVQRLLALLLLVAGGKLLMA